MTCFFSFHQYVIVFAISPSTGALERFDSNIAKICYKDRNILTSENLEVLYLLSLEDEREWNTFCNKSKYIHFIGGSQSRGCTFLSYDQQRKLQISGGIYYRISCDSCLH